MFDHPKIRHLIWLQLFKDNLAIADAKKTSDCLRKSMKIAGQCMDQLVQLQLFVELLNSWIYFNEKHCSEVWRIKSLPDIIPQT